MHLHLHRVCCALLIVGGFLIGPAATAQSYTFTASLLGGIGGSADADPDPGFGNPGFQLGFAWLSERKTHVGVRLGQVDFGGERLENLVESDLTYLNVAGEYRFTESYYESGIYFGLGLYSVSGTPPPGAADDEDTGLGVVVGLTGDFNVSKNFSVLVDLAGHFADVDGAQVFGTALVGVGYHF